MSIFNYDDYKKYIKERVSKMPKKGRGQYRQMSLALGVNSTVISQVFKGDRNLTPEQGLCLNDFLGHTKLEGRYFINLILKIRAGTKDLESFYAKECESIKKQSQEIKSRVKVDVEITEEHRALFYSDWHYSGLRMLSALPQYNTIDEFSDYFKLPRVKVRKAIEFLLSTGLCIEVNGQIKVGPKSTHLDSKSALVNSHRKNWRLKSIQSMQNESENDLYYSAPMTLSAKDALAIREDIVKFISKTLSKVKKSPEEQLMCLNIDWFNF